MTELILPCKHEEQVTKQVQPTIDLLTNMDEWHPDVLLQHAIQPADYKSGLVFRSAIESIRGTFIASSKPGREGLVKDVLENLLQRRWIEDYEQTGSRRRHDFTIVLKRDPAYFAALEVKGGEGNSINISERPLWAREFGVWCHLDGAIVNQPAHGAHAIINRLTNELVRRRKLVDVLFIKDILCGTRTRPCPKYSGREDKIGLQAAPDVFLFPQRVPSLDDPEPPVHTLDTLRLPELVLELFGVDTTAQGKHIWEVRVKVVELPNGRLRREVQVWHQGKVVGESKSRPWRP
ncbi:MAG: hypothetical protein J7M16_08065 [Anaerolineae bacterium]|nr:hypothetical protein [Anaerolineae bacterium]